MSTPILNAAEQFLAGHARVLDRRRFERLFTGGDAQPVRDALAAYRTADGGFGYGLEPDGRTPGAQPLAIVAALGIMHQTDTWDDEVVLGVCDWLAANAPEAGGAPAVTSTVDGWPHAPWWEPAPGIPFSPISTGQLLAQLVPAKVEHPWCTSATELMWEHTDSIDPTSEVDTSSPGFGYQMLGVARFLDTAADAARAEAAIDRLTTWLTAAVKLDPEQPEEGVSPLWFAPQPGSRLRQIYDPAMINAHLDHLAASQAEDGGWGPDWFAWSQVAVTEWRGAMTVDALYTLRVHGRLS